MMNASWNEKYQPKQLEDVVGGTTLKEKLEKYSWKKPLLLYGPSGVGKTLLVTLLAQEFNFDLIHIDEENLERIEEISQTGSLSGKKKIILCDQVETIHKIKTVTNFLKKTKIPTILITSDLKSPRLKTIKRLCEKIQMRRPRAATTVKILSAICAKEGIKVNSEILLKIADNSKGSIRSAVLDLEILGRGRQEIKEKDLELLETRDKLSDIYHTLNLILVKEDIKLAQSSTYNLSEKPGTVLLWIDENLPKVYSPGDLSNGFHYLSRADVFLGRIYRRQYWGFLRYAYSLMTAGVNTSKSRKVNYIRYQYPFYIIHLSQTKKIRSLKQKISEKLSLELHASSRVINKEYFPLFKILLKNNKITSEDLTAKFKLTEEEVEFLK